MTLHGSAYGRQVVLRFSDLEIVGLTVVLMVIVLFFLCAYWEFWGVWWD